MSRAPISEQEIHSQLKANADNSLKNENSLFTLLLSMSISKYERLLVTIQIKRKQLCGNLFDVTASASNFPDQLKTVCCIYGRLVVKTVQKNILV